MIRDELYYRLREELVKKGWDMGLIPEEMFDLYVETRRELEQLKSFLKVMSFPPEVFTGWEEIAAMIEEGKR